MSKLPVKKTDKNESLVKITAFSRRLFIKSFLASIAGCDVEIGKEKNLTGRGYYEVVLLKGTEVRYDPFHNMEQFGNLMYSAMNNFGVCIHQGKSNGNSFLNIYTGTERSFTRNFKKSSKDEYMLAVCEGIFSVLI
jgi:hypothetical protein